MGNKIILPVVGTVVRPLGLALQLGRNENHRVVRTQLIHGENDDGEIIVVARVDIEPESTPFGKSTVANMSLFSWPNQNWEIVSEPRSR